MGETLPHGVEAPLDRARIRRLYDRIGRRYDLLRFAEAAPKRGALALLAVQPGERVLEVGVGTGRVLVELARAVADGRLPAVPLVAGIDLSPVMVATAARRLAAAGLSALAEPRVGDACALPFADGSFDAAFSSYVLDLLPASDIAGALAELRRVLRPGGRLALVALSPGRGAGGRLFIAAYE
nr:methyltransferase domain-containing protein [Ktedonobacterales bacterium]